MRLSRLAPLLILALCAAGLFAGSYSYFKRQELAQAAARLTLYRSTVENELRHFAHLPVVLSLDPVVIDTLAGGDTEVLNTRLARYAQSAGIDAIYVMDRSGNTISASNATSTNSFVGQNYAFRPYFQTALAGGLGEFYGIGATTGIPGYFYAMPVGPSGAAPTGVIAIKVDLATLQNSWQQSGERIILSNDDGIILLASEPDWRYRTLTPLSDTQRDRIVQARQFGQEPLPPLDWVPDTARQIARIDGQSLLYLSSQDLPNNWSLHFLIPDDQATARAWLTTGSLLFLSVLAVIALQIRRVRTMGEALRQSELEEAQLRSANERLAIEIDERRNAEKTLQKTQADLERAGRLAALGQLASSVTHELGQPIAAMRNQLAAAEITNGPSTLNDKISGLVERMEGITRQLKFFSRKGRDQFEVVELERVLAAAIDLLEPTLKQADATIDIKGPTTDTRVLGNVLRLEQVMTNIIRNALDAVEHAPERCITITLGGDSDTVWLTVSDTGHGLGGRSFDDLREPFATTRESGHGMGLGLTISAGIVTDHGGTVTATDNAQGGATFRITLPRAQTGGTP